MLGVVQILLMCGIIIVGSFLKGDYFMAGSNSEFMQEILDDVASYDGLRHPVKVGFLERKFTKKLSPDRLHPNPDDEFTHPDVGPHFGIISDYIKTIKNNQLHELPPLDPDDPLVVQKMFPSGYMLLNGHHRWAAAKRMGLKKVPVEVVSVTLDEDLIKMINKSDNTKRVSFDLDEVLIAGDKYPEEDAPSFPWSKIAKERLRKGAPALIHALANRGFDVWVYTSSYKSEKYIQAVFKGYKVCPAGIINGVSHKKKQKGALTGQVKEAMDRKYKMTLHIDEGHVLYIDKSTADYDYFSLECDNSNWASKVIHLVEELEEKKVENE